MDPLNNLRLADRGRKRKRSPSLHGPDSLPSLDPNEAFPMSGLQDQSSPRVSIKNSPPSSLTVNSPYKRHKNVSTLHQPLRWSTRSRVKKLRASSDSRHHLDPFKALDFNVASVVDAEIAVDVSGRRCSHDETMASDVDICAVDDVDILMQSGQGHQVDSKEDDTAEVNPFVGHGLLREETMVSDIPVCAVSDAGCYIQDFGSYAEDGHQVATTTTAEDTAAVTETNTLFGDYAMLNMDVHDMALHVDLGIALEHSTAMVVNPEAPDAITEVDISNFTGDDTRAEMTMDDMDDYVVDVNSVNSEPEHLATAAMDPEDSAEIAEIDLNSSREDPELETAVPDMDGCVVEVDSGVEREHLNATTIDSEAPADIAEVDLSIFAGEDHQLETAVPDMDDCVVEVDSGVGQEHLNVAIVDPEASADIADVDFNSSTGEEPKREKAVPQMDDYVGEVDSGVGQKHLNATAVDREASDVIVVDLNGTREGSQVEMTIPDIDACIVDDVDIHAQGLVSDVRPDTWTSGFDDVGPVIATNTGVKPNCSRFRDIAMQDRRHTLTAPEVGFESVARVTPFSFTPSDYEQASLVESTCPPVDITSVSPMHAEISDSNGLSAPAPQSTKADFNICMVQPVISLVELAPHTHGLTDVHPQGTHAVLSETLVGPPSILSTLAQGEFTPVPVSNGPSADEVLPWGGGAKMVVSDEEVTESNSTSNMSLDSLNNLQTEDMPIPDIVMVTDVDINQLLAGHDSQNRESTGMVVDPPEREDNTFDSPEQAPRSSSNTEYCPQTVHPFRNGQNAKYPRQTSPQTYPSFLSDDYYQSEFEEEDPVYKQPTSPPKSKPRSSKPKSSHTQPASEGMNSQDLRVLEKEISRLIEGFKDDRGLHQHFKMLFSLNSLPRTTLLAMLHSFIAMSKLRADGEPVTPAIVQPLGFAPNSVDTEDHEVLEAEIVQLLEELRTDTALYQHFERLLSLKSLPRTILLSMIQNVLATSRSGSEHHVPENDMEATPTPRQKKKAGEVRRRPLSKTVLAQTVRDEAKQMLQPDGQPLQSATPAEVDMFSGGKHLGPTKDDFRLDFISKGLWNPWNQAATRIFAEEIKKVDGCEELDEEQVRRAFRTHLRQLKARWSHPSNVPKSQGVLEQEQQNRREQRRRRTLEHRTQAIATYHAKDPSMSEVYKASRLLTYDVMSEEESSDEGFIIKRQPWRSRELQDFLRYCTALHMSFKHLPDQKFSSGAFPTPRQYEAGGQLLSTATAVPGLPANFYDDAWLNNPEYPNRRIAMKVKPVANLTLPETVLR
ncbi:hypothetical protein VKT23_020020 [Stygiomarasmius scandens]|uniref:Uncharacterized protein n=1 Tax=Marasmiellus scandens TaxID=2682957 RepID=A0ABR1INL1_9AGAR